MVIVGESTLLLSGSFTTLCSFLLLGLTLLWLLHFCGFVPHLTLLAVSGVREVNNTAGGCSRTRNGGHGPPHSHTLSKRLRRVLVGLRGRAFCKFITGTDGVIPLRV